MDKYDYIESIISELRGTTGINFQNKVGVVLKKYAEFFGLTFEMPRHYGGDKKNDGWIKEKDLYYQIYAPINLDGKSFKKSIQTKFSEDLSGLLKIIYEEKRWSQQLKEFIFIVNTIDNNLPEDSERFFESTVKELEKKYKIEFIFEVVNLDYIRKLLNLLNKENLEKVSSELRLLPYIDSFACDEKLVYDAIMEISKNISDSVIVTSTSDYKRISTIKKININDLESEREDIENIMLKLDTVEEAMKFFNSDIESQNKFERVKNYICQIYNELSSTFDGKELYENINKKILENSEYGKELQTPIKFLVVYIFDKCDIFKKEE